MKPFLTVLLGVSLWVGCKGDITGDDPFDTYQLCFDDQTERQLKPVLDSIVECCLTHPIDGVVEVCKETVPDCINYLTANLLETDAGIVEVMDGCMMYIEKLEMQQ